MHRAAASPSAFAASAAAAVLAACAAAPADPFAAGWELLAAPRAVSLRAIEIVDGDPDVLWAAGSDGCVLRSTDGGDHFAEVGPADRRASDVRSLVAFDAGTAWIATAGEPAQVLGTTDGGASWRVLHEDTRPGAFFDCLAAWDRRRALLFGDPIDGRAQLWRTADGGASWQLADVAASPAALAFAPGEAGFAASDSLLVPRPGGVAFAATGGARARLLRSEDGGERWHAVPLPLQQGTASQGAFAIAFQDDRTGVAVGGDYRDQGRGDGTAASTRDGGRTWTASPGGASGYRCGVAFVRGVADAVVAVGDGGCSVSRDGGRSWHPLPGPGFHAVRCAADGTLWAVGAGGRIGRLRTRPSR